MIPLNTDILPTESINSQKTAESLAAKISNPNGRDHESMKKSAIQFEQMMMGQMYRTMYDSVQRSDFFGDAFSEKMFMGLFIDETMKKASMGKNGIASVILNQWESKHSWKDYRNHDRRSDTAKVAATTFTPDVKLDKALEKLAAEKISAGSIAQGLDKMMNDLSGRVSSDFGMRVHPIHHVKKFHHGIDYALPEGTPLQAPGKGVVEFAGRKGGYGNTVILNHGNDVKTVYAHLSEVCVKQGDTIPDNALIGKVGSTGISTGPHLHLEVRIKDTPVDPRRLAVSENKTQGVSSLTDKVK